MLRSGKINIFNKILLSFLLIIVIVLQISFLSYLIKGLANIDTNDKNVIMNYKNTNSIDYDVILKDNDLIPSEYKNSDGAYILDLVDHIRIKSLYKFKSDSVTKVFGNNRLVARLKVYYKESTDKNNNPEILKKEDVLKENKIDFDDVNYSISTSYDIYLKDYLDILNKFRDDVKINVDGYLEIDNEVNFSGNAGGASYTENLINSLKIPLSDSVLQIEKTENKVDNKKVYSNDFVKTNSSVKIYLVVANILIFIVLMLLLKLLFKCTNRTKYQIEIRKLTKNYDDIIVNTKNLINFEDYKIVEIPEFKEILNLSRELLLPIMNYELIKNVETWFYVIKDDVLYRYIVSASDLEKNKK